MKWLENIFLCNFFFLTVIPIECSHSMISSHLGFQIFSKKASWTIFNKSRAAFLPLDFEFMIHVKLCIMLLEIKPLVKFFIKSIQDVGLLRKGTISPIIVCLS